VRSLQGGGIDRLCKQRLVLFFMVKCMRHRSIDAGEKVPHDPSATMSTFSNLYSNTNRLLDSSSAPESCFEDPWPVSEMLSVLFLGI
jgi:hypothetical protein